MQGNLAITYNELGRHEEALSLRRDVYFGRLKLSGKEHEETIREASNYAINLLDLRRFKEAKSLLCKWAPVAQRVFGAEHWRTLSLREDLARATLAGDSSSKEKRKALQTLEETLGVMRRVLGAAHPETQRVQRQLEAHRREFSGAA